MASPLPSFFIPLAILVLFCAHVSEAQAPETGTSLIEETCRDTNYYDLCVSAFESDVRSVKAVYKDLGPIKLHLVLTNATDTCTHIHKLLAKATKPDLKKRLRECYEIYKAIVEDLKSVKGSFKDWDFQPLVSVMRSAQSKAMVCENGFKKGGLNSPLTGRNEIFSQLADNGFVIFSDMMV